MKLSEKLLVVALVLLVVLGAVSVYAAGVGGGVESAAVPPDGSVSADLSEAGEDGENAPGDRLVSVSASAGGPFAYTLTEEAVIRENDTPLGSAPTMKDCCVLHFVLMACALAVTIYYTYDRKKHQKREFELRCELR